ncbi:MAG: hypothetical protein RIS76_1199, partial [Verrucomicrobiota bacterium]
MFSADTRRAALMIWAGLNGLLVARAVLWALWRPSGVWQERGTVGRWAFWPALLMTLLLRSSLEPWAAEVTGQWIPSSVVYAISGLIFMPVLLVVALLWGMLGAAVGGFSGRRRPSDGGAVRWGIRIWWITTLVAWMVSD